MDRYFVGGSGEKNWNDTANWSDVSGGAGGASVPTPADNAIFDANSLTGACNLTLNALAECLDFDCSAITQELRLTSSVYEFHVFASFTLSALFIHSFSATAYLHLKTSNTCYITTAGVSLTNYMYINGSGTFINQDEFNPGSRLFFVRGTWDTNNQPININELRTAAGEKTWILGNSYIRCYNLSCTHPITTQAGTSTIEVIGDYIRHFGNLNNVLITTDNGIAVGAGYFTCENLTRINGNDLPVYADFTVNQTLTLIAPSATDRLLVKSYSLGTPRIITCNGIINAEYLDFRDIEATGTADWDLSAIVGGSGDCGGNSGITFTQPLNLYYKTVESEASWSNAANWFLASNGQGGQGRIPLAQDTAIFDENSFSQACTLAIDYEVMPNVDMGNVAKILTANLMNNVYLYGNFYAGENVNLVGVIYPSTIYIYTRLDNPCQFNVVNKILSNGIYRGFIIFNEISAFKLTGNLALEGDFRTTSNVEIPLIDLNGFNLNCDEFYFFRPSYIYLRSGTISCNKFTSYLGIRLYAEESTIITNTLGYLDGTDLNKVIVLNSSPIPLLSTAYDVRINELVLTTGKAYTFSANKREYKIGKLTTPNHGEPITLNTDTGNAVDIDYTGAISNHDYLNISNLNVLQPKRLFAGLNSVDGGNNSGIVFGVAELAEPDFTEAEVIESNLLAQPHITSQLSQSEQLQALLNGTVSVEANLTEASDLFSQLQARVFARFTATELAEMDLTIFAKQYAQVLFTESEWSFMRRYEKITGTSLFTLLITGQSNFTDTISGTSNFY